MLLNKHIQLASKVGKKHDCLYRSAWEGLGFTRGMNDIGREREREGLLAVTLVSVEQLSCMISLFLFN